jgi:hypothetical protein
MMGDSLTISSATLKQAHLCFGHPSIVASRQAIPEWRRSEISKMSRSFSVPDGMQLVFYLVLFSSFFDKVFDFFQLVITARFEPAGVMKDKAVSRWKLELVFDIVFSALDNCCECIIIGGRRTIRYRPTLRVSTLI